MTKTRTSRTQVEFLAKGTYQRMEFETTLNDFVAGTEQVVTAMSDNIAAPETTEAMYSWIRFTTFVVDQGDWSVFEYAVVRCDADDAMQNLNDETAVEELHREGRILSRDLVMQPAPLYGRMRELELEFYNVKLLPDEQLRFIVRPLRTSAGSAGQARAYGVLEWRQVGE